MATWRDKDVVLCLTGGLLLGVTVSVRMALWGKVTGSSGILAKTFKPNATVPTEERVQAATFTGAMVIGGVAAQHLMPSAFESWEKVPKAMLVVAGLCVGFGTQMGNGCTSGHGICGISSFRIRSLVATCTFMTTGVITAVVSDASSYLPEFKNTVDYQTASIVFAACTVGCCVLPGLARHGVFDPATSKPGTVSAVRLVGEAFTGFSFAMGLAMSNMTRCSATLSFLDVRTWNPALMFVMGGAIALTAPSYYYLFHKKGTPFWSEGFTLATKTGIDARLICGASLFGIGWGLMGACPAPAVTNLLVTTSRPENYIYMFCLLGGMYLHEGFEYLLKWYYPSADEKKASGSHEVVVDA